MPITPAALAAAADLKHRQLAERIASGKKWCPRCREFLSRESFGPKRTGRGDCLAGYCRTCAAAYKRDVAAAARQAAAAVTAAARARAWETERQRWATRDPAPTAAPDPEERALVVAVRWRLGVGDADAARVARLVALRRTVSRGPVPGRMLDRVEAFVALSDAEAAELAQRAGVTLPERRRRAA